MIISKNRNSTKPRKRSIIIVCILLCVGILLLTYFYIISNTSSNTKVNTKTGTSTSLNSSQTQTPESTKVGSGGSDQPVVPKTANGSDKQNISMQITSAIKSGSVFRIRLIIYLASDSGVCTLNLSKTGSQTITKTAAIQPMSSTSTCQGFDVPTSEMSNGEWTVNVSFENGSYYANSSQVIDLQGL